MSGFNMLRLATVAVLLVGSSAHAQLFRAYLSGAGLDSNPCTLQAPCRLLPAALNAVAAGGEVWMLNSANYNTGPVTVSKSVSILAIPGAVGSLVATGGPAISITSANLTVALRNLVIAPVVTMPAGTMGVSMTGASRLIIENCLLANLPEEGVRVEAAGSLKVTDSTLRNNGAVAIGLYSGATATVSSSRLLANVGGGVAAFGNSAATTSASVSDSVISGGTAGVNAFASNSNALARISLTSSLVERTSNALDSRTTGVGTAEVNVGGSLIVDNGNAWNQAGPGSTVLSLGDNQFSGNIGAVGTKASLTPQ